MVGASLKPLEHTCPVHISVGMMKSGRGRQSTYKYVCGRKTRQSMQVLWIAKAGRMQQGPVQQEREAASSAAGLIGLEVSYWLTKNAVHASIAVERCKAALCVFSSMWPSGVESVACV